MVAVEVKVRDAPKRVDVVAVEVKVRDTPKRFDVVAVEVKVREAPKGVDVVAVEVKVWEKPRGVDVVAVEVKSPPHEEKPVVAVEVKVWEAPKRVGMVDGSPNVKPKGFSLIESDFASTPLESFITHPVNVSSFLFKYLSTGMDVFSIHLFSPES